MWPIPLPMWAIKIASMALVIAFIGIVAYSKGRSAEKLEWQAKEAQFLADQLKEVEIQRKANEQLVAKYQEVEKQRNNYYRKIQDEIKNTTHDTACLGADAVSVWNAAIDSTRDMPKHSAGFAKRATGASDTEVLGNHVANMQQYAECRDVHQKIREWAKDK